jgi:hypothetical protein
MANPIALPREIVLAIGTLKATPIDPNDFNNAVQELYNRGFGKQGKWIQEHKDLYLEALQNGFVADDAVVPEVPKSEIKNVVPPTPGNPSGYETGTQYPPIEKVGPPMGTPQANEPEVDEIKPEAPVEASAGETISNDGTEPEDPEDKPHKRK